MKEDLSWNGKLRSKLGLIQGEGGLIAHRPKHCDNWGQGTGELGQQASLYPHSAEDRVEFSCRNPQSGMYLAADHPLEIVGEDTSIVVRLYPICKLRYFRKAPNKEGLKCLNGSLFLLWGPPGTLSRTPVGPRTAL